MRKLILFTVGMLLTLQSLFGNNQYRRCMYYSKHPRYVTYIRCGEAFMEGILTAIVIMILIVSFLVMWELV